MGGAGADAALWAWLLVLARVAPVAWWAPPGAAAPAVVRGALAIGLSALVASALPAAAVAPVAALGPAARVVAIAREAAIGAVIALVASVPVLMMEAAGRLADLAHGPRAEAGPLTGFTRLAALVVFFGIGGHLAVARAVADSYQALPVAAAPPLAAFERAALAVAHLVAAGLWIAVPWLLTAAIVSLGAAAARRASGLVGGAAPVDAARQIAVVAAVGLGAVAAAAVLATQLRAALAVLGGLWT